MKVAVAQTSPIKGDVCQNLNQHLSFIQKAGENNVDILVFPELSLTGYEPTLAKSLAMTSKQIEIELVQIQRLANQHQISVAVGLPTKTDNNPDEIFISLAIFEPNQSIKIYSKQILYPNELSIFAAGKDGIILSIDDKKIALAICYELSQEFHQNQSKLNNANIYIASVCNSISGIDHDLNHLSCFAKNNKILTLMANYVGHSGGYECAGKSSVWGTNGNLIAQMSDSEQGILIFDTKENRNYSILIN